MKTEGPWDFPNLRGRGLGGMQLEKSSNLFRSQLAFPLSWQGAEVWGRIQE
jgi:hypothetical protein